VPFQFQRAAPKSFYSSLAGAFTYPFKAPESSSSSAPRCHAALTFVRGGLFGSSNDCDLRGHFPVHAEIIHTTTSDENEDMSSRLSAASSVLHFNSPSSFSPRSDPTCGVDDVLHEQENAP